MMMMIRVVVSMVQEYKRITKLGAERHCLASRSSRSSRASATISTVMACSGPHPKLSRNHHGSRGPTSGAWAFSWAPVR
jgi:hypothetical protein